MGTTSADSNTTITTYTSCMNEYQSVEGSSSSTTNSSAIDSRSVLMSGVTTSPRSTSSVRMPTSSSQQYTPSPSWSTSEIISGGLSAAHTNSEQSIGKSTKTPPSSTVKMEDLNKYERISSEIESLARSSQAEASSGENETVLKQLRRDVRKVRRTSNRILQSQKELLEKMSRHERSGFRRLLFVNREQKMEKLRSKLASKLVESVGIDEELQRLERQTLALTGNSCESSSSTSLVEQDELVLLEHERQNLMNTIVISSRRTDIQELHSRLVLFSSEKKASQSVLKQVEECESYYRKALSQLRHALSIIVAPSYTGLLKEFVLGPYPLAVEAAHLVDRAGRMIQPQSCRKYSEYAPKLCHVHIPEFPPPMVDFAKRGARSNFDPNNAAAIEAIRKLRLSENVVILMQRMVIEKLELIEKWRKVVESDLGQAETGSHKCTSKLQEYMQKLLTCPAAA